MKLNSITLEDPIEITWKHKGSETPIEYTSKLDLNKLKSIFSILKLQSMIIADTAKVYQALKSTKIQINKSDMKVTKLLIDLEANLITIVYQFEVTYSVEITHIITTGIMEGNIKVNKLN